MRMRILQRLAAAAAFIGLCSGAAQAGVIDFTSGLPAPGDGNVPFNKTDSGVAFTFTPITNLVGGPHWVAGANGLSFGGGSGSSLAFAFVADADITLDSYTLGGGVIQLGNPDFDILEGITSLSASNDANAALTTLLFNSGPIALSSGTTYTFEVNTFGAGIQRQMASWQFSLADSPVPGPVPLALLLPGLALLVARGPGLGTRHPSSHLLG